MKDILVIYGGDSPEHEISCVSAQCIVKNLLEGKNNVQLVGVTRSGEWFLQQDEVLKDIERLDALPIEEDKPQVSIHPHVGLFAGNKKLECDCVFPMMHGKNGEDGSIHTVMHIANLPCVGASHVANAVSMHKVFAKRIWRDAGLPVLPFRWVRNVDFENTITRSNVFDMLAREIGFPLFIKPTESGSSCGISKVSKIEELEVAILEAFEYSESFLAEPARPVREVEVSIVGNAELTSFPPGEIVVRNEFYSYDEKYSNASTTQIQAPADIPVELQNNFRNLAERAYALLDCRGYARVDFFLDTQTNKIYLNELNTIPGFTHISMFPKLAEVQGISYKELIDKIVMLAIDRHHADTIPSYK